MHVFPQGLPLLQFFWASAGEIVRDEATSSNAQIDVFMHVDITRKALGL
jgi:hypothetical protein